MSIVTHRCGFGHEGCSLTGSGGACTDPVENRKGPNVQEDLAAVYEREGFGREGSGVGKVPDAGVASQTKDAWSDRSTFVCQTCMWFLWKGDPRYGRGRCRRHAPTLGGYPAVYGNDFCGDHKLR